MTSQVPRRAVASLAGCVMRPAQSNVVKFGVPLRHPRHQRHHRRRRAAGADAKVGDATTLILVYERLFDPTSASSW